MSQGLAEGSSQSTALPVEIGFLAHYGYAPEALRDAAMLAEFTGVAADVFLLKQGLIGETEFYRALAAELRLPFLSTFQLSPEAPYPDSILTGLAPLSKPKGGFVMAPSGENLAQLLKGRHPSKFPVAITTPALLTKAIFQIQARSIANRAAYDLPRFDPSLSSHDGISLQQIAVLALVALFLSFSLHTAPALTLAGLAGLLSPLFLGIVVLKLAAAALPNPLEPAAPLLRANDAELPIYTIIVALYREKRIASRLITALSRLDYPAAKLDIKLVLEADDRETREALEAARLPGCIEVIIAPPGQPRTKPRALNVAIPLARGRYTVVYDAEDVPDPGQLRLAVAAFDHQPADVACLQARLTIDNTDDSWLTHLFTIEYAALFDVLNPGLADINAPVLLGGTSNHFRTSILKSIHGWDAWNVTEDADLGIRLARSGYRVADLASSTLEEAPMTLRAWLRQRTRWMKGFMQTTISHSRRPWTTLLQLGPWRFYGALILTFGTVLSALAYPLFTGLFLIMWLSGTTWIVNSNWEAAWYAFSLMLFLFGGASVFIPACVALHRRRLWRLLPWVLLLPFYYTLVSVAAWRGLWELAVAPFRWNKTSHGLARTSRTGLLQKHQASAAVTMSLKITPP